MKYWSLPVPAQPRGSAWWPGQKARVRMLVHIQSHRHSHKHRTCLHRRAVSHQRSSPVSLKSTTVLIFGNNEYIFQCFFLQNNFTLINIFIICILQYCFWFILWSYSLFVGGGFSVPSCFGCWRPWLWTISQCSTVSIIWYYCLPSYAQHCVLLSWNCEDYLW